MAAKKKSTKKAARKTKRTTMRASARRVTVTKRTTKRTARKPSAAFMAPLMPSSDLAMVIGASALPRTEVTKKIWAYIKRNGLQDKTNKRMINADDKLRTVFGGKRQVSMFEMTKLVSRHLKSTK